jgi:hypothetical protein
MSVFGLVIIRHSNFVILNSHNFHCRPKMKMSGFTEVEMSS